MLLLAADGNKNIKAQELRLGMRDLKSGAAKASRTEALRRFGAHWLCANGSGTEGRARSGRKVKARWSEFAGCRVEECRVTTSQAASASIIMMMEPIAAEAPHASKERGRELAGYLYGCRALPATYAACTRARACVQRIVVG